MGETDLNIGLGLRAPHYGHILDHRPDVSWFEAISENYLGRTGGGGGRPLQVLDRIRETYRLALHGVSLSIGSTDPLDFDYLNRLKTLVDRVSPEWISDHICWTGVGGENLHDLLPLPYTEEALEHLCPRILRVQDFLGRRMAFENVSAYLSFTHAEMTEWEFLQELSKRADCDLLLDVNNVYVSSQNQGFDAAIYLKALPRERIAEMHLAGHSQSGACLIDTHDAPVAAPVWQLFRTAVQLFPGVPTLIEWDAKIPAFDRLQEEAARAKLIWEGRD